MLLFLVLGFAPIDEDCTASYQLPPAQGEQRLIQRSGNGLWIGGTPFTAADIETASAETDRLTGEWMIAIGFTKAGNAKFIAAQHCGTGWPIEISVDGKLVSRPILRERIIGGKANVTGDFTQDTASALAARLAPPPVTSSDPAPH